jgi:hypothetical protein
MAHLLTLSPTHRPSSRQQGHEDEKEPWPTAREKSTGPGTNTMLEPGASAVLRAKEPKPEQGQMSPDCGLGVECDFSSWKWGKGLHT